MKLPLLAPGRQSLARPLGPKEKPQVIECAFDVRIIGTVRKVTVFMGSLRYATGREILTARLLADHGECIIHGRNGKCITVLRDPFIRERPSRVGMPRVQWSRDPAQPERTEGHANPKTPRRNVVSTGQPMHTPEKCPNDCRGRRGGNEWALAVGAVPPSENEHHPMCFFAKAWARTLTKHETGYVVYDLDRSAIAREASESEVKEAQQAERELGAAQVVIAERVYAVLTRKDAEQAMREAAGIYDEETALEAPPSSAELAELAELSESDAPSFDPIDADFPLLGNESVEDDSYGIDAEAAAQSEAMEALLVSPVEHGPQQRGLDLEPEPIPQRHAEARSFEAPSRTGRAIPPARQPRVKLPPKQPQARKPEPALSRMSERAQWPDLDQAGPQREKEQARMTVETYLARSVPEDARS